MGKVVLARRCGAAGKGGKGGGREAKGREGLIYRYDALPLGDGFGYNVGMADAQMRETCRWFHLTPGRLILAALAAEGFLLLSERLSWLGLDHHKGWPVLVAVATVALAMVLMFLWFAAALLFRWRFQFSIRSLLVLPVIVAILGSWLAVERKQATQQRDAVAAIRELGGHVMYDYQDRAEREEHDPDPPGPAWARKLLGVDFFADVVSAEDSSVPLPPRCPAGRRPRPR